MGIGLELGSKRGTGSAVAALQSPRACNSSSWSARARDDAAEAAGSAAHLALPYWFDGARDVGDAHALLLAALSGKVGTRTWRCRAGLMVREASVTLALYSSLP